MNAVVSRDGRNTTKIRLENPQVVVSVTEDYGEPAKSLYCLAANNLYVEGYRYKGEIQAMTPGFSICSCSALTLIMIYPAGSGQGKRDSPWHLFVCLIPFVRPSKIPEQSAKVMDGAKIFAGPCDCSYLDQESQCFDSCPAPVVLDKNVLCHAFVILNYGH